MWWKIANCKGPVSDFPGQFKGCDLMRVPRLPRLSASLCIANGEQQKWNPASSATQKFDRAPSIPLMLQTSELNTLDSVKCRFRTVNCSLTVVSVHPLRTVSTWTKSYRKHSIVELFDHWNTEHINPDKSVLFLFVYYQDQIDANVMWAVKIKMCLIKALAQLFQIGRFNEPHLQFGGRDECLMIWVHSYFRSSLTGPAQL